MQTPVAWTVADILQVTAGSLVCGDRERWFAGISIDSRQTGPEEIFIAIRGQVHDAHRFIGDAVDRGARGLMVQTERLAQLPVTRWEEIGVTCIAVKDTTRALGSMAAFLRRRSEVKVVAVTGSTGKTTTREMTASVVSRRFNTLTAPKNFNNEIGLPLTLFRLAPSHEWAVVELGMNHPGEISRLGEICLPDIGVITNIGPVHLEGVGSIEGVMQAKGELLEKIKPDGAAVLNADDPRVRRLARSTDRKVTLFGRAEDADIRAEAVRESSRGVSFALILPEESVPVDLPAPGTFMVSNALAAAGVGSLLGLAGNEIKAGLESFRPMEGRMTIVQTEGGVYLINDAYNANPVSVKAALQTLSFLKGEHRGFAALGDMLELGREAEAMHREIGAEAARIRVERLCVTGAFSESVSYGATAAGMDAASIFTGTKDEIVEDLKRRLQPGDWVLVKGSRAIGMEQVVKKLLSWGTRNHTP